ncbi:MAG: transglycosylase SLT domain-containing protein [Desulforhopalus sp.]
MKQRHHPTIRILLTLLFILGIATETCGSLHSSVKKYQNSTISSSEIKRLARYDHLIRYFSGFSYFVPRHKVSPDFIRALILAESGANPKAISNKNALGLGQILLSTGKDAAKRLAQSKTSFRYVSKKRLENLHSNDLFDPAVNILITCYLVAKYNHKFEGKLDLVVSAWNAGEYTESLSRGRHAPYRETENLIGKVNAYYVYLLKHKIFP